LDLSCTHRGSAGQSSSLTFIEVRICVWRETERNGRDRPQELQPRRTRQRRRAFAGGVTADSASPAFEDSFLIDTSPAIGIHGTNHIVGEYMLTGEDVLSGCRFEDGITAGGWPIDIHSPLLSCEWRSDRLRDYYPIPYRCLLPKRVENVLVPGRAMSATHEAWGSARAMATCMSMGQAAGVAAAVAVERGVSVRQVGEDFATLKSGLVGQGVFLGWNSPCHGDITPGIRQVRTRR